MSNPHDALFKLVFADPEHAGSLLRSAIPAELARAIDWQSLERVSISFVDEELSERYADLLFAAKLGDRPTLLYFLCEHQSTSDPWMPLRLLDYSVRAWTDWRRKHPDAIKLPAIFPIVLHHSESGWSATTRFLDLIDLDEETKRAAAPHLVDFSFILDDLSRQSDDEIHVRALTALGEIVALALKNLRYAQDPLHVLEMLVPLMRKVMCAPTGLAALAPVLRYVIEVSSAELDDVRDLFATALGPSAGEAVMTAAERLKQQGITEGRLEGIARGLVEGRASVVLKLLSLKFGPLAPAVVERVKAASIDELDHWAERILSANTLEDVLR